VRFQQGVALVEALVSILIFSFGILGLIGLEATAIDSSVDAEDRNRASLFASDIASAMWLADTVDKTNPLLAPQFAAWNTSVSNAAGTGMSNGTLNIITVPTFLNSAGIIIAADITITWRPPARNSPTQLSTLTTRVILP
jgi:type IV pilus assembly protein PilV